MLFDLEGVTLLDPDLFWDPELDIGPHRLMASGAFLVYKIDKVQSLRIMIIVEINK